MLLMSVVIRVVKDYVSSSHRMASNEDCSFVWYLAKAKMKKKTEKKKGNRYDTFTQEKSHSPNLSLSFSRLLFVCLFVCYFSSSSSSSSLSPLASPHPCLLWVGFGKKMSERRAGSEGHQRDKLPSRKSAACLLQHCPFVHLSLSNC